MLRSTLDESLWSQGERGEGRAVWLWVFKMGETWFYIQTRFLINPFWEIKWTHSMLILFILQLRYSFYYCCYYCCYYWTWHCIYYCHYLSINMATPTSTTAPSTSSTLLLLLLLLLLLWVLSIIIFSANFLLPLLLLPAASVTTNIDKYY